MAVSEEHKGHDLSWIGPTGATLTGFALDKYLPADAHWAQIAWTVVALWWCVWFLTRAPVRRVLTRARERATAMVGLGVFIAGGAVCLLVFLLTTPGAAAPAGTRGSTGEDPRSFIQVHPSDLMPLLSKKPQIFSLEKNAKPSEYFEENFQTFAIYTGHWWAVETRLSRIEKETDGRVRVWAYEGDAKPKFVCEMNPEKTRGLLSSKPGDLIKIIGRVTMINSMVMMEDCEVNPPSVGSNVTFFKVPK